MSVGEEVVSSFPRRGPRADRISMEAEEFRHQRVLRVITIYILSWKAFTYNTDLGFKGGGCEFAGLSR